MPKMRTSFDGLVKLLAKHLYPEPNVFIRELIQNAHDSIQLRRVDEPEIGGEIDVVADPSNRSIVFTDNGMGMDQADIEEFLATIGSTGTGVRTAELARQNVSVDTIGQFGIGLLSAFVVAERIDVFTRKRGAETGWHWVNHGGEDYDLSQTDEAPSPGTRVVVTVGADHVHIIEEEDVRKIIKRYADFLPFRIMLNGNGPVNVIDAPWHRAGWASDDDYNQALRLFLNERYPDVPLHAIPVDLESPKAKGALYVSDQHIPGINTSGVVDVFQERMCVRLSDQELLPDWAKFVRGVVDSPALQPTASRDNVIKDAAYFALRKALGELIVQSLIRLAATDREKFHRLCDWHHFHLKGMAVHNQGFFDAVIDYLPFETNEGNLSLKEYLGRQKMEPGKRVPVYFFSYGYDSTQFYELANAKGLLAINTGRNFDETLIRRYVERRSDTLELKQLDHLDDPDLYERLAEEERRLFVPLENAMRHALEWGGISRVRPSTRRFAPESMSGVLIQTQKIEAYEKMEALLSQPFMMEGLGELAEEVKQKMRETPLDLFINADNPLIQELSRLGELDDPRYRLALIGVYNCAFLLCQHRITPDNARVLYGQFQTHILESLKLEREVREARREKEEIQTQLIEKGLGHTTDDHDWARLFVMMPYDREYDALERALRDILEFPPYCFELRLARDRVIDASVTRNVVANIRASDGYVADVSTQSPNVMMEVGWAHFDPQFETRALLLLRADDGEELPVDLAGRVAVRYSSLGSERLRDELRESFEKHELLQELVGRERKRFLSPALLRDFRFLDAGDEDSRRAICRACRTVEDLLGIDDDEFRRRVRDGGGDEQLGDILAPLKRHLTAI